MESERVRDCPRCAETVSAEADYCAVCGELFTSARCAGHPDREAVGRCVICGRAVCRECRSGERQACLCEEHASVPVIEGWAQVYSTGDEIEAQLIEENLRAEGIDSRVFSQKDRSFAVALGDLSPVRVLVPAYAYTDALQVIRGHLSQEGEVVFACPQCGEAVEEDAETCESCGAALGRR